MSSPAAMKLLLSLACLFSFVRGQVTYVTILYGNSVPKFVKKDVVASTDDLLDTLNATTPAAFDVVPAGETIPTRARELASNDQRMLPLIDCPNKCSNSGSDYCRSLGCAYCGSCNRRNLRGLQDATVDPTEVELAITEQVSNLCDGASPDCELWTKVYILNADGTLTDPSTI